MFTWANISALLQALPYILRIFQAAVDYAATEKGRAMGRAEAVAEALKMGADQMAVAAQVARDADKAHADHPADDGGFDPDFQRKGNP